MQKVVFLHIPKTGGTTLKHLIYEIFGRDTTLKVWGSGRHNPNYGPYEFAVEPISVMDSFKAAVGHIPVVNYIEKKQTAINEQYLFWNCTIIRNPLDRFLSLWNYCIQKPNIPSKVLDMTFKEFSSTSKNGMCNWLSGKEDADFTYEYLQTHFQAIGTTEQLVLLQNHIISKFGQEGIDYSEIINQKRNVTKKILLREDLSKATIETILQNNKEDQKLYNLVKDKGLVLFD